MRQEYVEVGKLRLSLPHLKCLRREELEQWVGNHEAERLLAKAFKHKVVLKPIHAEIRYGYGRLALSPGVTLVSGLEFTITPPPIYLSGDRDADFLWNLLVILPQRLDSMRAPVYVEELENRFSCNVIEGAKYALDVMERISSVYKIPFVVSGSAELVNLWGWLHTLIKARGSRGEAVLFVDGEVKVFR
ncbi:MAG: hypothetical protein NZ954_05045 [Thermofilaceae archaeon]|nr:hypothetical protein [Thermofilaceae archaeon]MCX8180173.1 hypothetical protein [Thermofilaceae archaeon]MDW8004171.1 hypothetical protein [Thermofilaceae archaeon]